MIVDDGESLRYVSDVPARPLVHRHQALELRSASLCDRGREGPVLDVALDEVERLLVRGELADGHDVVDALSGVSGREQEREAGDRQHEHDRGEDLLARELHLAGAMLL